MPARMGISHARGAPGSTTPLRPGAARITPYGGPLMEDSLWRAPYGGSGSQGAQCVAAEEAQCVAVEEAQRVVGVFGKNYPNGSVMAPNGLKLWENGATLPIKLFGLLLIYFRLFI